MKFQLVEEIEAEAETNITKEDAIINNLINDLRERSDFLKKYAENLEKKMNSANTTVDGKLNPQVQAYKAAVEEMEDIAERIADILSKRGR